MQFNELATAHCQWIEAMGWHNKTQLETLALIASEIGEAFAECASPAPSDAFGEELADIALRVMDLACTRGIDIDAELLDCKLTWPATERTIHSTLGQLMVDLAQAINASRGDDQAVVLNNALVTMLARLDVIGRLLPDSNLAAEIHRKMAINSQRGTRGRKL